MIQIARPFLVVKRSQNGAERGTITWAKVCVVKSNALLVYDLIGGQIIGGIVLKEDVGEMLKRHIDICVEAVATWGHRRTAQLLPD